MNDPFYHSDLNKMEALVERYKEDLVELKNEKKRFSEALLYLMANAHQLERHTIWKTCVNALYPKEGELPNDSI